MQLPTWGHVTVFSYQGSVQAGTDIEYGQAGSLVGQTGHHITHYCNRSELSCTAIEF